MTDFEAIVAAHSSAVWRTAYRLLANREDALDCCQETFLDALRVSGRGPVRHWRSLLVRIATRRAIDRLRERYRRDEKTNSCEQLATLPAAEMAPDAPVQCAELREHVRRALAELPPQQAEAFWLRHVEQLSPAEIAEQLQIEPGNLRVLVHRAAAGLRRLLGPSFGLAPISEESP